MVSSLRRGSMRMLPRAKGQPSAFGFSQSLPQRGRSFQIERLFQFVDPPGRFRLGQRCACSDKVLRYDRCAPVIGSSPLTQSSGSFRVLDEVLVFGLSFMAAS